MSLWIMHLICSTLACCWNSHLDAARTNRCSEVMARRRRWLADSRHHGGDTSNMAAHDAVNVAVHGEHGDQRSQDAAEEVEVDHESHVDNRHERTRRAIDELLRFSCRINRAAFSWKYYFEQNNVLLLFYVSDCIVWFYCCVVVKWDMPCALVCVCTPRSTQPFIPLGLHRLPGYLHGVMATGPSRGWSRGVSYPGPCDVWGPRRRSEIQSTLKCTILRRKIQKFSPQRGFAKMFEGSCENASPDPAVALNGPVWRTHSSVPGGR